MSNNLMPFDELNVFKENIRNELSNQGEDKKLNADKMIDELLDILIMSYVYGNESANNSLQAKVEPNEDEMKACIYKRVAGENFIDRVQKYAENNQVEEIIRVAETDITRVYNDATLWTAEQSNVPCTKTWVTMMDEKVRDSHSYLEGMTIPLEAKFYSYDGDSADYPGGFQLAQNNVNCRCAIEVNPV